MECSTNFDSYSLLSKLRRGLATPGLSTRWKDRLLVNSLCHTLDRVNVLGDDHSGHSGSVLDISDPYQVDERVLAVSTHYLGQKMVNYSSAGEMTERELACSYLKESPVTLIVFEYGEWICLIRARSIHLSAMP